MSFTAYAPTDGSLEIFTISVSPVGTSSPEEVGVLDEEGGGATDDGIDTVEDPGSAIGGGAVTDDGGGDGRIRLAAL